MFEAQARGFFVNDRFRKVREAKGNWHVNVACRVVSFEAGESVGNVGGPQNKL